MDKKKSELLSELRDPMRWFQLDHLPHDLQVVVGLFEPTAEWLAYMRRFSDQADVALQRLLEAKDAAVRAMIDAQKIAEIEGCDLPKHPDRLSS